MRIRVLVLAICCSCFFALDRAAAQDKVELFGGYSFVHSSVPVTSTILCPGPSCPMTTSNFHPNLNGWEFSGTYKPGAIIGLTADFSGNYGKVGSSSAHMQNYLFGPQVSFPARVSPFVHILVGATHESIGNGSPGGFLVTIPTSNTAFAAVVGGGIDISAAPFLSIRPIQVDYLMTRFNSTNQNQPRVSAGVVFHF